MNFTKAGVVADAYSQMRISGITVNPTPQDVEVALNRLETMMAELSARHVCMNYEFEENPNPSTFHGVDRRHHYMMATNLAVRLCPDFGKDVPAKLQSAATVSYETSSSIAAVETIREVPYPSRMPRGAGQRRFNRWRRFFPSNRPPVTSCSNTQMKFGDVRDIVEPFVAYLQGETISSYTIDATDGLTISNDANNTDNISYRVTTSGGGGENATDQHVVIVITTNTGRVETRERLFLVTPRAKT